MFRECYFDATVMIRDQNGIGGDRAADSCSTASLLFRIQEEPRQEQQVYISHGAGIIVQETRNVCAILHTLV